MNRYRFKIFFIVIFLFCILMVYAVDNLKDIISEYQSGKLSKAYQGIKSLIERGDTRREVYIYAGIIYSDFGENTEALSILFNGLQKYPEDKTILKIIGRNYIRAGKYIESVAILKRLVKKGGGDYRVFEYLGDGYAGMGHLKDAIKNYQKSLKKNEREPWVYIKMGRLYKRLLLFSDAEECFKRALVISREDKRSTLEKSAIFELNLLKKERK